jgi:hypothetical protein
MVNAERGGIGHAPNQATGTKATAFAGKRYNPAVSTLATPDTEKPMGGDPTTKIGFHLVDDKRRYFPAAGFDFG